MTRSPASSSITAANDTDPNRSFNPDVLLTIAECLEDIKHYQSVISLSCVSRYFADSLKPFRARLRKRVILRLGDVDVNAKAGWRSVKFIECDRNSSYPIPRDLFATDQEARKKKIKSALKPSVIRYMGKPHECAFRVQQELFPSATVMRFLYDPFAQDLASVFPAKSAKGEETASDLFHRMVPPIPLRYRDDDVPAAPTTTVRVIEYLKKGFEFRDLNLLPERQIQSTIRIKTNDGLNYYQEYFERYEPSLGSLQSLLATNFSHVYALKHDSSDITTLIQSPTYPSFSLHVLSQPKTLQVMNRTYLRKIAIDIYLKPTEDVIETFPTGLLFEAFPEDHPKTFELIFDSLQNMGQRNLRRSQLSSIKFRLYFIHGDDSETSRTPKIRRPDHRRFERPGLLRRVRYHPERAYVEEYDHQGGTNPWESDSDYDEEEEDEERDVNVEYLHTSPERDEEQKPVLTLEFTKSRGKVRTTETTFDRDVLECHMNGYCSRRE